MPDIAEEYRPAFCTALDLTVECFALFHKALEAYFAPKDKLQKIRKRNKAVGELESRIDQIERDLTARIFRSSLDLSEKIHLRHALRRISDISDATENEFLSIFERQFQRLDKDQDGELKVADTK